MNKFELKQEINRIIDADIKRDKWWEQDLAWVLKHIIWESEKIDYKAANSRKLEDRLAEEYAHKINLWLNYGHGDIYSFDEFLTRVKTESFTDYDGSGDFIDNDTGKTIKSVNCNSNWLINNKPENSDYIMWYNK